jgi:hypothetical protein
MRKTSYCGYKEEPDGTIHPINIPALEAERDELRAHIEKIKTALTDLQYAAAQAVKEFDIGEDAPAFHKAMSRLNVSSLRAVNALRS